MFIRLKHISYFFLLTILSLTVQSTVTGFLKDDSIVKTQLSSNNAQPSEEEDELETEFFHNDAIALLLANVSATDIQWLENVSSVPSGVSNIYTPPPKI